MTSSIVSERITTASVILRENGKGGEKRMAREGKELDALSKEELVMEFVAARYRYAMFVDSVERLRQFDVQGTFDDDLLRVPSEEWLRRIALYAWENRDRDDAYFCGADLMDYGVDSDDGYRVFDELCEEGLADWPAPDERSPHHQEYLAEREEGCPFEDPPRIGGDWDDLMGCTEEQLRSWISRIEDMEDGLRSELAGVAARFALPDDMPRIPGADLRCPRDVSRGRRR